MGMKNRPAVHPQKSAQKSKKRLSSGNNMRLNLINNISIKAPTVYYKQVLNNRTILQNNKKDKIVVKQFS